MLKHRELNQASCSIRCFLIGTSFPVLRMLLLFLMIYLAIVYVHHAWVSTERVVAQADLLLIAVLLASGEPLVTS